MNMYGIIKPALEPEAKQPSWLSRAISRIKSLRWLFLIVIVPTAVVAFYYYAIASDQYESEASFLVKSNSSGNSTPSGVGALIGLTGGIDQTQSEIQSVPEYLLSHDAVGALRAQFDLVGAFRRPETDFLSRVWSDNPTPEALLRYYKGHIDIHLNHDTGIASLKVRAFRPGDSYAIITRLLDLGEQRVNEMNTRSYRDAVAMATGQMAVAENNVSQIQRRITAFRRGNADIDPQVSGEAQIRLVSGLNERLAQARSQLAAMGGFISHSSPQYMALLRQASSLEREIAAQSSELAGGRTTIADSLGGYEDLKIRQEFAGKQYEAAAANLERAREDARRQQLYIVRVVNPNLPVKSEYPKRGATVLTVFISLLLIYAIAWLILAGVREHSA